MLTALGRPSPSSGLKWSTVTVPKVFLPLNSEGIDHGCPSSYAFIVASADHYSVQAEGHGTERSFGEPKFPFARQVAILHGFLAAFCKNVGRGLENVSAGFLL